jgi:urea carboxylase-associated protein 2
VPISAASVPLWEDTIQGGASWSLILRRGNLLRLEDTVGGANAATLLYNLEFPVERCNMPDTLKGQHIAHLTTGCILVSDMGRVMAAITADSVGWHDPLGGFSNAAAVKAKYGEANYQEHRNAWHRNAHTNLLAEAAKYGLGLRDLGPSVNFFSKVQVAEDGDMQFIPENSQSGDFVEIRAEMNLLVLIDTGQHPLDPNPVYAPKPIHFSLHKAAPSAADDPCRLSRPENARAFINTERYFA